MSHSTGSSKFDSIPYHDKVYPEIDPSQYPSSTFSEKVVLITGSGRGIGKALGLAFASLGAKVCFTDLTLEPAHLAADEAANLHGVETHAVQADIRIYSDLERLVKECVAKLGEVDVLVNNAGYGDFLTFDIARPEEYWDTITLNLKGPMDLTRLVLPSMVKRDTGVIICNTTTGAVDNYPFCIPYMIAKTGLSPASCNFNSLGQAKLMHCLQMELKDTQIKCFHIHPGTPKTMMGDPNYAMRPYVQQERPRLKEWVFGYLPSLDEDIRLGVWTMVYLAAGRADAMKGRYVNANHDIGEVLKRIGKVEEDDMYTLKADTFNAVKAEKAAKDFYIENKY